MTDARAGQDPEEVAVSAPERTVVDLLGALEQSVKDAREARKRHPSRQCPSCRVFIALDAWEDHQC